MDVEMNACFKALLVGLHVYTCVPCAVHASLSPSETLVWGPGLEAEATLPVRYFFIQARDEAGGNVSESLGADAFQVSVLLAGDASARVRAWVQVFDRNDGSYLARFKLMESYADLVVSVLYGKHHVARSPYRLTGRVYHEKCYCPVTQTSDWMSMMHCPSAYAQIDRDLEGFDRVDMRQVADHLTAK